jgi:hypothetical protein
MQQQLVEVSGLAVAYLVTAAVWVLVTAGIYQLVRDKTRHVRVMPRRFRRLVREGYGQQAH